MGLNEDSSSSDALISFEVWVDDKLKAHPAMKIGETQPVSVNLEGAFVFEIRIECIAGTGVPVWIDPRVR